MEAVVQRKAGSTSHGFVDGNNHACSKKIDLHVRTEQTILSDNHLLNNNKT